MAGKYGSGTPGVTERSASVRRLPRFRLETGVFQRVECNRRRRPWSRGFRGVRSSHSRHRPPGVEADRPGTGGR
jgi:hypothetical protein